MRDLRFIGDCGTYARTVIRDGDKFILGCFEGTYQEAVDAIKKKYQYPQDYISVLDELKTMSYDDCDGDIDVVMYYVAKMGYIDVFKDLLESCNESDDLRLPYQLAATHGKLDILKIIDDKGYDVNHNHSLSDATEKGHFNVVKYLVEKGADVNSENAYGFRYACKNKHYDIINYLIEKGVYVDACRMYAIRQACRYGDLKVLEILLDNGSAMDSIMNPIRLGALNNKFDVIDMIFSKRDMTRLEPMLLDLIWYLKDIGRIEMAEHIEKSINKNKF